MQERADSSIRTFPIGSILLLTITFHISFLARIILAPLMPIIESDLGVTHGGAGSLFLLLSVGHTTMLFFSGHVSSRLSHYGTILLSSLSAGVALLAVALIGTLLSVKIGLIVVGLATGLYLPSAIAALTELVDPTRWGRAVAIHELATNAAFFSAPLIVELLIGSVGWRAILGIVGAASVMVGCGFSLFRGGRQRGSAPSMAVLRNLYSKPLFWMMVVLFALGVGGNFGYYSMLPLYLVSARGMERELANSLISLSRFAGVGVIFISGWVADRLGPWRTLIGLLLGTGLLTLLTGVVPTGWIIPILLLQPLSAVSFFPPALSSLSSLSSARLRNVIVSQTMSFGLLIGTGAIPAGIGALGERGLFSLGIVLLGAASVVGGAMLAVHVHRRTKQEAGIEQLRI